MSGDIHVLAAVTETVHINPLASQIAGVIFIAFFVMVLAGLVAFTALVIWLVGGGGD